MFEPRCEWVVCRQRAGSRRDDLAKATAFLESYAALLQPYVRHRLYYLLIELGQSIAGGIVSGVSLSLPGDAGCKYAAVFNGILLAQFVGTILVTTVLRPFSTLFDHILTIVSAALSCGAMIVLLASEFEYGDSTLSWIALAQSLVGVVSFPWIVKRAISRLMSIAGLVNHQSGSTPAGRKSAIVEMSSSFSRIAVWRDMSFSLSSDDTVELLLADLEAPGKAPLQVERLHRLVRLICRRRQASHSY